MGSFIQLLVVMLSIFPSWFAVLVLGFMALLVIFIVIKIVAFVLDAIPFL